MKPFNWPSGSVRAILVLSLAAMLSALAWYGFVRLPDHKITENIVFALTNAFALAAGYFLASHKQQ